MEFWLNVLNEALIVATFAVSVNVILGVAGQLSLASVGLGGVAGYLAAYLSAKHGVAFVPALAAGAAAAFVAGFVLAVPALRLKQNYVILLTLAFGVVVLAVIEAIPVLGGTNGLLGIQLVDFGGPLRTAKDLLRLIGLVAVLCWLFCWRLDASPFGRVLRGIREDPDATEALGKHVVRYKITTFAWTGAVAGVAGVMLVYYSQIASPTQFDFNTTTLILAAVVVGGIGSLPGSIVGALLLTAIGPVLQRTVNLSPETATLWQLIIYGVLLGVIMRVRPTGIIPEGAFRKLVSRQRGPDAGDVERPEDAHGVSAHLAPEVHVPSGATNREVPARDEQGTVILRASGLVKHFRGIRAVQGFDLELKAGQVTALVGPNGAGKTTVFNLLTGRIRPDGGEVILRGKDITALPAYRVAHLGMVRSFQDVRIISQLSLLDNVALGVPRQPGEHMPSLFLRPLACRRGEARARATAKACLEFVGLENRAGDLAGRLGYGDQKLLVIARLLATGGDVLLIDEPAAGIDRSKLEPVLEVVERLRADGKTICLVEHNLDVVQRLSDEVVFMEEGRVTARGTMDTITSDERLASVYFGHV
jgi:branched-chain amino acid transport system permease protein